MQSWCLPLHPSPTPPLKRNRTLPVRISIIKRFFVSRPQPLDTKQWKMRARYPPHLISVLSPQWTPSLMHCSFDGSILVGNHIKLFTFQGDENQYGRLGVFECLPCPEGCESCEDDRPCVVSLDWVMRTTILVLSCIVICCLPIVVVFTWKYGNVKVIVCGMLRCQCLKYAHFWHYVLLLFTNE